MKKLLSLILALVMIMSLVTVPAAAEETVDEASDLITGVSFDGIDENVVFDAENNTVRIYYTGTEYDLSSYVSDPSGIKLERKGDYVPVIVSFAASGLANQTLYHTLKIKESVEAEDVFTVKVYQTAMSIRSVALAEDAEVDYHYNAAEKTLAVAKLDGLTDSDFVATLNPVGLFEEGDITCVLDGDTLTVTAENSDGVYFEDEVTVVEGVSDLYADVTLAIKAPGEASLSTVKLDNVTYNLSDLVVEDELPDGMTFDAAKKKFTISDATKVDEDLTVKVAGVAKKTGKADQTIVLNVELDVTVDELDLKLKVQLEGSTKWTATSLKSLVVEKTSASDKSTDVESIVFTPVGTPDGSFYQKYVSKTSTSNVAFDFSEPVGTDGLTFVPEADFEEDELDVVAVVKGWTYVGKATLMLNFEEFVAEQTAKFSKEDFFLGAVSFKNEDNKSVTLEEYWDKDEYLLYSNTKKDYTDGLVYLYENPGYSETNEEVVMEIIGKDVVKTDEEYMYRGELTLKLKPYDIGLTAEVDKAGFMSSTDFLNFAKAVMKEQNPATYSKFTNITLDNVEFTYDSDIEFCDNKNVETELADASELSKIHVETEKPGIYDVDFVISVDYKDEDKVADSEEIYGVLRLTVDGGEGDIIYDVDYNKTVKFDENDFQKFFAAKFPKGKLESVIFEEDPAAGKLYAVWSTTASKRDEVDVTDTDYVFYLKAETDEYDLDKVTYLADSTPKTEYSVYIPFTAYGETAKGASESLEGVVEIIVNGKLPFTDITKTHTFYEYIKYVYREGIMNGKTTTTFDAKSNVTRIQLVRTLYRMAGSPTTYDNKTLDFTDCKKLSGEAASALKWAVNTKIVNGYGNTFKPDDAVTRQAMVTILYRFANYYDYDTAVTSTKNLTGFKDAAKVSKSMTEAMNWAVENGFVSGTSTKMLNPQGSTTRGACAKILAGFHAFYEIG